MLITDLPPAAAARAGLAAGELRAAYPDLVVVSVTPFGLAGELAEAWGDSLLAESYGGLAAMIGDPSRRPLSLGGEQAAHAAGIVGFLGAMLALRRRDLGAGGDLVDVAMSDVAAYIDWKSDIGYASTGLVPLRAGVTAGRWRLMPASDGLVGIVFQPEQWHLVVGLIGDDRLADPALADELEREGRGGEWWPAIGEWVARRTKLEVYHEAQRAGLAFGYCADVADLAASPQYQARHFVATPPASRGRRVRGRPRSPARCCAAPSSAGGTGRCPHSARGRRRRGRPARPRRRPPPARRGQQAARRGPRAVARPSRRWPGCGSSTSARSPRAPRRAGCWPTTGPPC